MAALGAPAGWRPSQVVIVRSKQEDDATVRLTSLPLEHGLTRRDVSTRTIRLPEAVPHLDRSACIVLHHDDYPAAAAVRAAIDAGSQAVVACLGSDIYSFDDYLALNDVASFFVMPTDLHRSVLSAQLYKPVFTIPEAIDRAVAAGPSVAKPTRATRRTCWFGYSESFDKGMASLVPVIAAAGSAGQIDGFTAILDEDKFDNRFGITTLAYDHTSFGSDIAVFDYAILSHFALDLNLNSLIKSPNKALTALMAGLIPLASDTPSYGRLFRDLGLERYLFDSPRALAELLARLDPEADARYIQDLGVLDQILENYSETAVADRFLDACKQANAKKSQRDPAIGLMPPPAPPEYNLSWHLRDLGPSAGRMLRAKTNELVGLFR